MFCTVCECQLRIEIIDKWTNFIDSVSRAFFVLSIHFLYISTKSTTYIAAVVVVLAVVDYTFAEEADDTAVGAECFCCGCIVLLLQVQLQFAVAVYLLPILL